MNGAWTAAPSTHHPHTSGDTTLPPLLPSPISTPPLSYLNPSPLLSQPLPPPISIPPLSYLNPSPLLSQPLPPPISTPPLSYLNPSPLLSQPLPSPISTPPLSYLNPSPLLPQPLPSPTYLNPSPPFLSINAPALLRYLSYISRLVAAEKPYKPHSRSVRLRTLRITCVPLMDKERCVCVYTCERAGVA